MSLPPQWYPSMSFFPPAATTARGFAAMPPNAATSICPTPGSPLPFPQFGQSTHQFAPLHVAPATPTYPAYGYTYFPTAPPSRFPSMSAVPTLSSTATIKGNNDNAVGIGNGARSSSCANPMDIFGTTSPELTAIPVERALPATGFASPCSSVYSPVAFKDQLGGGKLKRGKSPPSEMPNLEPTTSRRAAVDLAPSLDDQYAAVEVGPRKRSRTAQACERCRIRKARCFGGNPCNRCTKRKFACEFTASRQRGPNKPRRDVLPSFGNHDHDHVNGQPPYPSHAHAIAQPYHRTHQAHAHQHGQDASLPRARRHASGQHTKSRARRHSVHSVSSGSGVSLPSLLKPLPVHAGSPLSIGLGLELTPPAEEDAEGWSDPDVNRLSANANANATAMSVSLPADRSMSWTGFGAATMFSSARDMWNPSVANTTGPGMLPAYTADLNLYTSMLEEDMFPSSPPVTSQSNEDMEWLFNFPFTPLLLTIPLPLQSMATQPSTAVSQNHTPAPSPSQLYTSTNASTTSSASPQDANDLSADPTLVPMQDDFVSIRNGALRELYRNPAGGDLFRQPFQAQSADAY